MIDICVNRTLSCSTEIGHHLHRVQRDGGKEEAGTRALGSLHFSGGLGLSPAWGHGEKLAQLLLSKCKLWKRDGKTKGNNEHSTGPGSLHFWTLTKCSLSCLFLCLFRSGLLSGGDWPGAQALCFLKGVTTFPGPRNHGQGPWHKAQPCSSLGPEVQARCQSEDHGHFMYEKQWGGKVWGGPGSNVSVVLEVQGNEEQTQAWEEAWTGGSWRAGGGDFYFLNRCRVFQLC